MNHAVLAPPGSDVRAELDRLLDTDPACADRDEIAELVSTATKVRAWLDAYEVRCARRTRELADAGRSEPVGSMFARNGQRSAKDAARVDDRNTVCDDFGSFEDALVDGRISAGHLDGVAAAIRDLDDATRAEFTAAAHELLDAAVNETVDTFARHCRELSRYLVASRARSDADELDRQRAASSVKRWVDKVTGMCHTHAELDPIRDAALSSAIDAAPGAAAPGRRQRRYPVGPVEGRRVRSRRSPAASHAATPPMPVVTALMVLMVPSTTRSMRCGCRRSLS